MASFISPSDSVIDLGCGKMWLRSHLNGNAYYAVDYKQRDDNTVVADFNKHEFPNLVADVAFISGALEYVEDCEWFVRQVCSCSKRCIVSYCTTEYYPVLSKRTLKAWKSHLSRSALLELFAKNGMRLEAESTAVAQNPIFVFSKYGDEAGKEENTQ